LGWRRLARFGVFAGVFEKNGGWTWCFDGQLVVNSVVKLVIGRTLLWARKYGTISVFILG
jgi:hypothetical protein